MDIYSYTDYRVFLKDYYDDMKSKKPYFSYRYFSKLAGVNAPNFLYLILQGKRNLTKKSVTKVSSALGLNEQELTYFENMVFYTQAKTIDEKNLYYSHMLKSRSPQPIQEIKEEQMEYLNKWYYCAIRELIPMINFEGDFEDLANKLKPKITANQAKLAVELLLELELLVINEDGTYSQNDKSIFLHKNGFTALLLEEFHNLMMEKAIEANKTTPRKERLLASTTFSISKKTFDFFVKRTREFRRELQEVARLDDNPEQVFQYVFNIFPLSDNIND